METATEHVSVCACKGSGPGAHCDDYWECRDFACGDLRTQLWHTPLYLLRIFLRDNQRSTEGLGAVLSLGRRICRNDIRILMEAKIWRGNEHTSVHNGIYAEETGRFPNFTDRPLVMKQETPMIKMSRSGYHEPVNKEEEAWKLNRYRISGAASSNFETHIVLILQK